MSKFPRFIVETNKFWKRQICAPKFPPGLAMLCHAGTAQVGVGLILCAKIQRIWPYPKNNLAPKIMENHSHFFFSRGAYKCYKLISFWERETKHMFFWAISTEWCITMGMSPRMSEEPTYFPRLTGTTLKATKRPRKRPRNGAAGASLNVALIKSQCKRCFAWRSIQATWQIVKTTGKVIGKKCI